MHRFIAEDGSLRAAALCAPHIVSQMQAIANMSPLATIAGGRCLLGAALLASRQKDDRLSVQFAGNGPIGRIYCESAYDGKTRVSMENPGVDLPLKNGSFDVSGALGIGLLTVTQIAKMHSQSYKGTVIIKTGEIGEDIAFFLQQSFQIPSIVALGVHLDKNAQVNAAGGVLIELMPGHKEEDVLRLEQNVAKSRGISDLLLQGASADDLVKEFTGDKVIKKIDAAEPLIYSCHCSKERVEKSLVLLGDKEVQALIDQPDMAEIRCDFCGQTYHLSNDDLQMLLSDTSVH